MTEPSPSRPVPGPPRPGPSGSGQPSPAPAPAASREHGVPAGEQPAGSADGRFADLEQRPVAEHVAAFEDEHARLQHELSTIDQL
jgi:hypothetical protein